MYVSKMQILFFNHSTSEINTIKRNYLHFIKQHKQRQIQYMNRKKKVHLPVHGRK